MRARAFQALRVFELEALLPRLLRLQRFIVRVPREVVFPTRGSGTGRRLLLVRLPADAFKFCVLSLSLSRS